MSTNLKAPKLILPFPRVVRIEPASQCNLACNHCPTGTIEMERGVMKKDTFDKIFEAIQTERDKIKVVVLYHGGEPLLNKQFFEMVKRLRTLGNIMIKTVTNGMVMTDSMMTQLADCGLDSIEFSLDGLSPEQNDFIRVNSQYSKIVSNIKRLIRYLDGHQKGKPEVFIATTQFKNHSPAKEDGNPALPEHLLNEFSGPEKIDPSHFKSTYAMHWPHIHIPDEVYDVVIDPADDTVRNYCDHVINTISIRDNGDVVPCCYDLTSQSVMGNVHEESLSAIWNNPAYQALRQSIHEKKFIPLCDGCNVVKPNAFLHVKENAFPDA
ncbi:MAG: radical SAM protein [Candidatus Nitronauta litoralis]|uniref:Radical SAM protein n=1 Tax=Candidatus Nitronauta litoralis TaxID=2705533 RepID=A0A7T0G0P9_9BACT|nr:MAG: radical SAM protein [Candidatus Nitronauta litoralis]